jgi:enolase-phosphatase E1
MHKAIILDIEGTIRPISFVHDVLFPYSTERLLDYLRRNPLSNDLVEEILIENKKDFSNGYFAEIKNPQNIREIPAYLYHLFQVDCKFGPLKWLHGKIWKEGFELANLKAELFDDVPLLLRFCKENTILAYIYNIGNCS